MCWSAHVYAVMNHFHFEWKGYWLGIEHKWNDTWKRKKSMQWDINFVIPIIACIVISLTTSCSFDFIDLKIQKVTFIVLGYLLYYNDFPTYFFTLLNAFLFIIKFRWDSNKSNSTFYREMSGKAIFRESLESMYNLIRA